MNKKKTDKSDSATTENEILDGINRVFRQALTCETEEQLGLTCLSVAEELTGSQFGFIGEINPRGKFDTIAISNTGWCECRIPDSNKSLLINDMEIRDIWEGTVRTGASIIINDSPNHPNSVGIPEGHPPLTAFLGVALMDRDSPYGMVALVNEEGGYSQEDRRTVESLSIGCGRRQPGPSAYGGEW